METGIELITKERKRQIVEEGYLPEHDRLKYKNNELFYAACCYYGAKRSRVLGHDPVIAPFEWPWDEKWWKPSPENRLRELEKAGALFMASNHAKGRENLIDEWVLMCAKEIDEINSVKPT